MRDVNISDQLGAMAVIDELRSKKKLVEESVDLHTLKSKVSAHIREYYSAQNIEVSDEVIAEGVSAYFSRRLRFSAKPLSAFGNIAANVYIGRKYLYISVAVCALCIGGLFYYQNSLENYPARLAEKMNSYSVTGCDSLNYAKNACLTAESGIDTLKKAANQELLSTAATSKSKLQGIYSGYEKQITEQLNVITSVVKAERTFRAIESQKAFSVNIDKYPVLKSADTEIKHALSLGLASSETLVSSLSAKVADVERSSALENSVLLLSNEFKAINLQEKDAALIGSGIESCLQSIYNLEMGQAVKSKANLDYLLMLAKTPIEMRIVGGEAQSGTIRDYSESGKSAYYLIVKALRPDGSPVKLKITSSETGVTSETDNFAVLVTKETYDKVRDDKLDDGQISNTLLAEKPRGSTSFSFASGMKGENLYITEW